MNKILKNALPLSCEDGWICDKNDNYLADILGAQREDICAEIVACVNACANIPNPAAIADVVDALKVARSMVVAWSIDSIGPEAAVKNVASIDAAIAKATGQAVQS